jgi:hypothetical protein
LNGAATLASLVSSPARLVEHLRLLAVERIELRVGQEQAGHGQEPGPLAVGQAGDGVVELEPLLLVGRVAGEVGLDLDQVGLLDQEPAHRQEERLAGLVDPLGVVVLAQRLLVGDLAALIAQLLVRFRRDLLVVDDVEHNFAAHGLPPR